MNTKITVQVTIMAPVDMVWEYYTNPHHIIHWNFTSDDWHCPKAENDLKIGGKYKARMEAKDGSWGFDFEAIYNEVIPQKEFTYTLADNRQATTRMKRQGDKTLVAVTFDAENQNPIDMQKDGWQAILDNFKRYVEVN